MLQRNIPVQRRRMACGLTRDSRVPEQGAILIPENPDVDLVWKRKGAAT
jgi:hypothetical protein